MSTLDIMMKLQATSDVVTQLGWNGFTTHQGQVLSLESLMGSPRYNTHAKHGMGDFMVANGPIFTDLPFSFNYIGRGYFYTAKLKREHIAGNFVEELTMTINPKNNAEEIYSEAGHTLGETIGKIGPWLCIYKRGIVGATDRVNLQNVPQWTPWSKNLADERMLNIEARNSAYYVEPQLTSTFHIENYNPAIPITLDSAYGTALLNRSIIISYKAIASGQPTLSDNVMPWGTQMWSKAERMVTNGKTGRILIDMNGRNNVLLSVFEEA